MFTKAAARGTRRSRRSPPRPQETAFRERIIPPADEETKRFYNAVRQVVRSRGLVQDSLDEITWASRALELREEEPSLTPEQAVERLRSTTPVQKGRG